MNRLASESPLDVFKLIINIFSLLCVSVLMSKVSIKEILCWFIFFLLIDIFLMKQSEKKKLVMVPSLVIISVVSLIILSAYFLEIWGDFPLLNQISESNTVRGGILLGVLLCLTLCAFPSIYRFLFNLSDFIGTFNSPKEKESSVTVMELVVIGLISVASITLMSKSSPLYPLNDWNDANIYYTVGKSMLAGKVPYRDLLDHKGPLLFMIHAIASLISYKSFFGIYIIELLCYFLFLLFALKTCKLLVGKSALLCIPFISFISCYSTCFFGDSAEELCVPFLMWSFFILLEYFEKDETLSPRKMVIYGVLAGIVFWIKYTVLGLFIGEILVYIVFELKKGRQKQLIKSILLFTVGFLVPTIPVILYFGLNKAVTDLNEVYFLSNIIGYGGDSQPLIIRLFNNLGNGFKNNKFLYLLLFLGIGFIESDLVDNRPSRFLYYISLLTCSFFIFFGKAFYLYYPYPLVVFILPGTAVMVLLIKYILFKVIPNENSVINIVLVSSSFVLVLTFSLLTRESRSIDKNSFPQFQFEKVILEKDNPSLLEYDYMGSSFYTVTGIIPECREFAILNTNQEESRKKQNEYLNKCLPDFVITENEELINEKYKLVLKGEYPDEDMEYYLYEVIDK